MKNTIYLLAIIGLMFSCGSNDTNTVEETPSLSELKKAVQEMEDSLNVLSQGNKKVPDVLKIELINRHLEIANNYSDSEDAAKSLDKVHMLYSGLNVYHKSAAYADTLLMRFPDYKDKLLLYESQGANYDIFIQPRDSAKVRHYYELLLKEDTTMSDEKRKGLERRLQNNHLNFDDYLTQVVIKEAV